MKKVNFNIKKWAVRAMVTAGAMLGITSCCVFRPHSNANANGNDNAPQKVSGPQYDKKPHETEILEDVYGPPVEKMETSRSEVSIEPEVPVGTKTQ